MYKHAKMITQKNLIIGFYPLKKFLKLTDYHSKGICSAKAEVNLKFLFLMLLHKCSLDSLKEKMHAEFSQVAMASHARLTLINGKQQNDESLPFICR